MANEGRDVAEGFGPAGNPLVNVVCRSFQQTGRGYIMGRGVPGAAFIARWFGGRRSSTLVTGRLSSGHRALAAPATARENPLVRLIS